MKFALQIEKITIFNDPRIFFFLLLLCSHVHVSSALAACDKSRKVFENVTYGEISHGANSNYTQVRIQDPKSNSN